MTYSVDTPMARLIADNYPLLQVMSRFGIKVGFGEATVAEVCERNRVDTDTFLTVCDLLLDGYRDIPPSGSIEQLRQRVKSLLRYIKQSHTYFLDFFLPAIRHKLLNGIRLTTEDVSFLIIRFFDDYVAEVRNHMDYEENIVFKYVNALLEGETPQDYTVSTYSHHHVEVSSKLTELKRLILKYCPQDADVNLLNAALYDMYRCESELESHCEVEDHLFVPAIKRLEKEVKTS